MTELTADQAIQTLRGLPEDRQRAILAKLSPEAKQGILAKLPSATSRFTSSAVAPVVGAVKGMLDARPNEAEKAKGLTSSYDFWMRPAERVVEAQTGQVDEARDLAKQGRYSEAAAHGIASVVPLVGPWVADAAQQFYDQLGKGDTAGALGTATGNMAIALAPKAVGKGYSALKATSESMRRGVSGTGTGATKDLVEKTKADNAAEVKRAGSEREKTLAANKAADEKTILERGKVEEHNAGLAEKNAAGQSEAEQVKAQVARRAEAQKELEDISSNMDVAVEKARHDALDVGNKKYSGVNEKLSHLPADMERTHSLYQDAADVIGDVQAEPPILRRLGKSLEKGGLLTYKDQQALYSELGKELSKGTLPGSTYHAYEILHEGIGEDMQRMADSQGQGAELTDARNYWRRMKQTFGKSSDVINNRASKAVNAANPKLLKSQANDYRIRLLSSFDPKIGEMANRANALRQEIDSLPKKEAAPSTATRKDYSEPNPTKPVEKPNVKTISPGEIRVAKAEALAAKADRLTQGRSTVANTMVAMDIIRNALHGNVEGIAMDLAARGIYSLGKKGMARLLQNPKVVDLLTKPTPQDMALIPPELRRDFPEIIEAAKVQGIKVSPRLTAAFGAASLTGPKTRQLQDMRRGNTAAAQ